MAFRKFAADYLFTGYQLLGKNSVLVTDEQGNVQDIIDADTISGGIERYNGILTPGFINCHCHLELSHLKQLIPRGSGMVEFLLTVMRNRDAASEIITEAIAAQEQYMRQKGIVAVGDVCNTADTLPVKSLSSLYYHNFIEATGFHASFADRRFGHAMDLYKQFFNEFASCTIVPHAPYSVSGELMKLINDAQPDALLSMHNQESKAETDFFFNASGDMLELYRQLKIDITHFESGQSTSLRHFLPLISNDHSLILVHNVHTTKDDLQWTIKNRESLPELWWCFCPNANLFISDQLPDMPLFMEHDARIVLGTDSLASNNQLNILEEMKTIQARFKNINTETLLKWATLNGALALRISNRYGSFEKGKKPGVVIIHGGSGTDLEGTVSRRIL